MKKIILCSLMIILAVSYVSTAGDERDQTEGKKLFLTFCSACHGREGKGNGEASKFLEKKPRDLTNQRIMFNRTDQELFDFINHSKKDFHGAQFIPAFRLEFEESQVWDIVAYIRSLSQKSRGDAVKGHKLFVGHCAPCHEQGDATGEESGEPSGADPADLTNDARLSKMTDRDLYIAIAEGGLMIHGPSIMPQWADKLTSEQTWDIIAYLRLLQRRQSYSGKRDEGKKIFEHNCSFCHGGDAKGQTLVSKAFTVPPPDLTDHAYQKDLTELGIYIAILGGGNAVGHSEFMPSWGEVLADREIWDLVAYIKSLEAEPEGAAK